MPSRRIDVKPPESYLPATSEEEITRRLDAVYGSEEGPADPFLAAASRATLRRSE